MPKREELPEALIEAVAAELAQNFVALDATPDYIFGREDFRCGAKDALEAALDSGYLPSVLEGKPGLHLTPTEIESVADWGRVKEHEWGFAPLWRLPSEGTFRIDAAIALRDVPQGLQGWRAASGDLPQHRPRGSPGPAGRRVGLEGRGRDASRLGRSPP